jgi:hypothetical protein
MLSPSYSKNKIPKIYLTGGLTIKKIVSSNLEFLVNLLSRCFTFIIIIFKEQYKYDFVSLIRFDYFTSLTRKSLPSA